MGKSWLSLRRAHLCLTGQTEFANSTTANKRDGHSISDSKVAHVFPDRGNSACKFVTRYMRKLNVGVMACPGMPVASTHSCCFDVDDHAALAWRRLVDFPYLERSTEILKIDGSHEAPD